MFSCFFKHNYVSERLKIVVFKFDKATSINLNEEDHGMWRIWKPLKELFFSYHINFLKASFSMDESYNSLKKASLAKWLSVRLRTMWLWIRVPLQSLKLQISRLFRARGSWHSSNYRVWIHSETPTWHDKNIQ